ncbi:MAG: PDDEXK nuclease domain-containing protein [bacterium]
MGEDKHELKKTNPDLFNRVVAILEKARTTVVRTVNSQMVIAYWLIGREIVEEEQKGSARAEYGRRLIKGLSMKLTERYGSGFSVANLKNFRQFYVTFKDRMPEIGYPAGSQSPPERKRDMLDGEWRENSYPMESQSQRKFHPDLSWSHYRALMRIESPDARSFYEIEAVRNHWNRRQLERQISSLLFERLLKSRDKEDVIKLANEGHVVEKPLDVIKDPYVLEFLDLPESHRLVESKLEEALITHLQEFLLELGNGFAFVGRQKRLTLEGDHFYPDLVFYHIKLKCYVIIDLKVARLSHQDLGQMQMYVHYYDREIRSLDDNPTIGLILCTDKNEAVVRYVLDEENRQIFASRYRFVLPDEQELAAELKREMELLSVGDNRA